MVTTEQQYRDFMKNIDRGDARRTGITFKDLLIAVADNESVSHVVNEVLSKPEPITVIVEGSSATEENVDTLLELVSARKNSGDKIILCDISENSVTEHKDYAAQQDSSVNFQVIQGDMYAIPLEDGSADIVINDCAINYCKTTDNNEKVIAEFERVLKSENAVGLLSVAVDRRYDDQKYGTDQEKVPESQWNKPGGFNVLPVPGSERRNAWPVPYYEREFQNAGLDFQKFDVDEGRSRFPESTGISYRRYMLQKK
jgi:hypothetical protein